MPNAIENRKTAAPIEASADVTPPSFEANRSGELEVFVTIASRGSFSAAARHLGVTPSAISKVAARLEARLGVQLLQRTTRKLELTAEGRRLFEEGQRVLDALADLEHAVARPGQPRGLVRINASTATGQCLLVPLVPKLLTALPGITLDLSFTDRVVDLIEARADIAIRWGRLPSSDIVARLLGYTRQVIVASPAWVAAHEPLEHPSQLSDYVRIGWNYPRAELDWPFKVDGAAGQLLQIPVDNTIRVNDGDAMRKLAVDGAGLARLSLYHAWDDIKQGRLVVLLEAFNTGQLEPIHAVYLGKPDRLPPRTRAVLDFLVAHVDLSHAEQLPVEWR